MSIDYNNFEVPSHIDTKFLEEALKSGFNDSTIKVKHAIFTGGTKQGENYCSQIRRATVTYSSNSANDQSVNLIVKFIGSDPMAMFFKSMRIFYRERDIYVEVLPKLKEILGGEDIAPKYFYFDDTAIETIIFEDVSPDGYKLGDAGNGVDEKHCQLLFEKLGRYHAASMVLARNHPEIYEKFKDNVKMPKSEDSPSFLGENFKYLAGIVKTWPGFEETSTKLEKFASFIELNYDISSGPTDNEIKVLAHDDLWTNNVLFKYENNSSIPTDIYFIDFQIAFFSSPGIDIMHFLYTSPKFEVLEARRDYMIENYYYEVFQSTLKKLNYSPIPSLDDIYEEMKKREIVGFVWTMIQLYVVCIDKDVEIERTMEALNDPETSEKLRYAGMTSKRFVKTMKYILRKMEEVGVLK